MTGIAAIRLLSPDPEGLAPFYERAFGFRRTGDGMVEDPFLPDPAFAVFLALGAAQVEIMQTRSSARVDAPGNDPRFQHFAMLAPDMGAAMERLRGSPGWSAISEDGAETLPPSSGSATAFKFRDPDGHPLEFLTLPVAMDPAAAGSALSGIDHSAVSVRDTDASVAFYRTFGFAPKDGTMNEGAGQARLDHVADPHVAVTPMRIPGARAPHLELLCYRSVMDTQPLDHDDPAATRLILSGGDTAMSGPDGHRWIVPASLVPR